MYCGAVVPSRILLILFFHIFIFLSLSSFFLSKSHSSRTTLLQVCVIYYIQLFFPMRNNVMYIIYIHTYIHYISLQVQLEIEIFNYAVCEDYTPRNRNLSEGVLLFTTTLCVHLPSVLMETWEIHNNNMHYYNTFSYGTPKVYCIKQRCYLYHGYIYIYT